MRKFDLQFEGRTRTVGGGAPTYFIADISANHDGDLQRAKDLVHLAAAAGADAAKFQNFRASHIVSREGFDHLGSQLSHQSKWKKTVYEVYEEASLPWEWTEVLFKECEQAGIDYCSTPYDFEAIEMLDSFVSYYKIGSGDINWPEMIQAVAQRGKPVFIATGASDIRDVQRAVRILDEAEVPICLMQCNTNYTASIENFQHIHLNVLRGFSVLFPNAVLGLSDHTSGHATVLGAVALGARAIEKHFTDDVSREGPDHPFSMTPVTWREMVDRTRELEAALGSATKVVAENELETVVVQRRCLRAATDVAEGTVLTREMVSALRPAPPDSIPPYRIEDVIGKRANLMLTRGQALRWSWLSEE